MNVNKIKMRKLCENLGYIVPKKMFSISLIKNMIYIKLYGIITNVNFIV